MNNFNLTSKNNHGITLIALVITIIVLLILAGISISLLFGQNGILTMANKAKTTWEQASEKERHQLDNAMEYNQVNSLYIWSIEDIIGNDKVKGINLSKLDYQVRTLGINTLYVQYGIYHQYGDKIDDNPAFQVLMKYAESKNIDVYLCDGEPTWYLDKNNTAITQILNTINTYNQTATKRIKGFISDIEFYLASDYQNATSDAERIALIKEYAEYSKGLCDLAESYNLSYAITLPYWLDADEFGTDALEEFYKIDFDHIAYMNYNRNYNIDSLSTEVALAKKYDKKIVSIAELQPFDSSEENLTFYNVGLDECLKTFDTLSKTYNYEKLGYSYHYYKPLVELIEKKYSDATDFYELIINPSVYGENVTPDQFKLVSDSNEELSGYTYTTSQNNTTSTSIIFYGLKFGNNYHLTLDSGEHSVEKDINYSKESNESYARTLGVPIAEKKYYTLELYGFDESNASASLCSGKLVSGSTSINGSLVDSGGYNILVFYGLEYDKEYTLELDDKSYTIVNGGKYSFPSQDQNYFGAGVTIKK